MGQKKSPAICQKITESYLLRPPPTGTLDSTRVNIVFIIISAINNIIVMTNGFACFRAFTLFINDKFHRVILHN